MVATEIVWRTDHGDTAGVTVHAPDADHDRIRLVIGPRLTLRLPRTEARLLAQALTDAANAKPAPAPAPARPVIPIHTAPPATLYHDPDTF